jgi:hypothetical protein
MPLGFSTSEFNGELNRLANGGTYPVRTAFLEEQGAANKWAGTNGLGIIAALNKKNGTTNPKDYKGMRAVCNALAGTTDKSPVAALRTIAS